MSGRCGRCGTDKGTCGLMVTANVDPGTAGHRPATSYIDDIILNLTTLGSHEQWRQWKNELFSQRTVDITDEAAVRAWHEAIYRRCAPQPIARSPCTVKRPLYYATRAPHKLPINDSVQCGDIGCDNRSVTCSHPRRSLAGCVDGFQLSWLSFRISWS